jgi:hypothetical protein
LVFFFPSIEDDDLIFFLLSVFNPKPTFDFSIDPLIDTFGFSINHPIFFCISIEGRIATLFLSTSKTGTFIFPDSIGFLLSKS